MSKIDHSLFDAHEHALEREYEVCPKCGSELVVRHAGKHSFWGCASYPQCDYSRPFKAPEATIMKVLDEAPCPCCHKPLAVKQGRFGMFIGCTGFPECHYIADDSDEKDTGTPCPQCRQGELLERVNRFGKTFYACDRYPKCKYVVNDPPVAVACPTCQWPVMVEKTVKGQRRYCCPVKGCSGQRTP
ncbi:topoisomerase DNA-binding C4 zinc finger domain-containing protein [Gallaecimonas sp. GXIMD1310]|uniref:DNA topoisomerase family protein n=1 Tax=Gallaecimonas sp. GXIMD1310 TaxID=3131926 RepID=UPI00325686FA